MRAELLIAVAMLSATACSAPPAGADSGAGGSGATGGGAGGAGGGTGGGGTGGSSGTLAIGEWTDAPGACPTGMTPIDITTLAGLQDATRGEGTHATDPAASCYLIHDGVYAQAGATLPVFIKAGGTSTTAHRVFVGQSRSGTIVRGRGSVADGVSHVTLRNLTFDLTGYSQSGSFNTLSLGTGGDVLVDHVTFTGDCLTGALGGHIETNDSTDVTITACLIEKFGRCGPNGHLEHGVYLGSGARISLINNVIRRNASRGVQLYTSSGAYGTLDHITLSRNRIYENGHANYEDGVVINGGGTGTITNVTLEHNLIYRNFYSGLRFVDLAQSAIVVTKNTFFDNGAGSTSTSRSELNLDDLGSGAGTSLTRNIVVAGNKVLNDCYDSAARGFAISDNVMKGTAPTGAAGNCVGGAVLLDPLFAAPDAGDFRPQASGALGYGAYAP